MSKFKKVLSLMVTAAITAGITFTGTMAYLTGEDSDVNVMTLGNVSIAQHEYERVVDTEGEYKKITTDRGEGYELREFTQNKPLYPSMNQVDAEWDSTQVNLDQLDTGRGAMDVFSNTLAVDKFVVVENTGKSDAYVRTLIAFELGAVEADDWSSLIMTSNHFSWDTPEIIGAIEIDGNSYIVVEYLYKGYNEGSTHHAGGILPVGEITYNSLAQVYMTADATNEDVEALDGNANGTYDILVLSQAVQTAGFSDPATALNAGFGKTTVALAAEWFKGVVADYEASQLSVWDGTTDTSWYNDTDSVFTLTSAAQFAGLNQILEAGTDTFEGKTIKLAVDMDMSAKEWIAGDEVDFMGTFDGQNHTIYNLNLEDWHDTAYGTYMGMFAFATDATIKNVTLDSASFQAYKSYGGAICGGAYGDCTFENITLKNCLNQTYNRGSGGIVGLAYSNSNYVFTDINIDNTNTIGSYWGTPDGCPGGLIGYFWTYKTDDGSIVVKDTYLAQQMNVYNDVVANYQWYAYRQAGMIVGYVQTEETIDGTTYPTLEKMSCENVTVEYGDWVNYYYCELEANSLAGSGPDYQFSRLTEIDSLDEIKSGDTWLKTGNFILLSGDDATCYHIVKGDDGMLVAHTHTSEENNVCVKLVFDQLYGGGKGVYGKTTHDGVTVIYNNK